MEEIGVFICGCIFFPSCFIIIRYFLYKFFGSQLTDGDVHNVTEKCVSSIQAAVATVVGLLIAIKCQKDIMTDRHWLTNTYAIFGIPYFTYDTFAMYFSYIYTKPDVQSKPFLQRLKHFAENSKAMLCHHLLLPLILFPSIIFFRKGLGDFFVGVLYMCEFTIPFISARMILAQLQMKHTWYYIVAGLSMIASFLISRVLVFPFLYWRYAVYRGIPLSQVPLGIPWKCNIGCLVILLPQIYWLLLMVRGAIKLFYKIYFKSKPQ
ncbi:TLC domain-containing protein 3A-like [Saccostrea echinata]|uniref:TLC domain-containing protein 3A-like n=1 Tax=Saccostrea echinata TaxID=191078 RepID=UPI002A80E0F7|nr:TLC domain-containing protein 3A-like [Saccostrea echinata]